MRHKSYSTAELTIDEAAFDLEAMDYEFLLFRDLASGQDAVIEPQEGGAYLLQYRDGPTGGTAGAWATAVEVMPQPAPPLSVVEARGLLDVTQEPKIFFTEPASGRGHVLYRRHDGHYGLLSPADEGS